MFKQWIFCVLLLFSQSASASVLVQCWDHSCLENGWTVQDYVSGYFIMDVACLRGSCMENGWITGDVRGNGSYTICRTGGCFKEGWFEKEKYTHENMDQVVCEMDEEKGERDCLTAGWTVYSRFGNSYTTCHRKDCRNFGWTNWRNGQSSTATCLNGGCFTEGWILH